MNSEKNEENATQSFDNSNDSKDKGEKAFFKKKNTKVQSKSRIWGKKILFYILAGIIISAGFSVYPFLKNKKESLWIPQLKWFTIQDSTSIKFEPFIIPFRKHGKFTYISLRISFELPNRELMDEMIEKNNWIRGIIYNILSENIHVLENVSSLMKLKHVIIDHVNNILKAGKINKTYITDFSTV